MQLWYLHFLVGLRTLIHVVHGQPCASQFKPANTTLYGFSQRCSTFSVLGEEIIGSIMPSGAQMYFKISTFYHECARYGCLQSYPICSQNCPCCKPYMGDDPGFSANISAPNNESSKYMQNLNCIIPVYVPVPTGIYFISCNFSGYAMANTSKLIQLQLFWNSMIVYYGPLTTNVYITAGKMSLPDCIWQWERGNTFPLNEYGVFRILLYDGFGNKISAATGGTERSIVAIDVQFWRFGTASNETVGGLTLDVHTTWQLTYQIQFGYCLITVYCTSVGKYQMKVIDHRSRVLGNTPTPFNVMPDEAWTGRKFIPPPAPQIYFLGDNSADKAIAGVAAPSGVAPAHVNRAVMRLLLTVPLLLSAVLVMINFPLNIES